MHNRNNINIQNLETLKLNNQVHIVSNTSFHSNRVLKSAEMFQVKVVLYFIVKVILEVANFRLHRKQSPY